MPLWRVVRALPLVLVIAASGCQKAAWTKVVATDGSVTVGELVESRPDAVVVRTPQGTQVTILRSRIRSVETPTPAQAADATNASAPAAASPPGVRHRFGREKPRRAGFLAPDGVSRGQESCLTSSDSRAAPAATVAKAV